MGHNILKMAAVVSTAAPVYIEDTFSTYLYTGNSTSGGTQTITNNIDLSTKGGMVWIKGRSAASNHILTDTTRGAGASATNNNALASNLTDAEDLGGSSYDFLSSFSTTGFVVTQGGTTTATRGTNYNNVTYASWTFRKQAKFFDVVTYTGDGVAGRTVPHNLGSVPGVIIVKLTSSSQDWRVYHRSLGATKYIDLNNTDAAGTLTTIWNDTAPTSTVFSVGTNSSVNNSGSTYVAYLFAHDAGGFGTAGTDNVISCGSFTTDGSGTVPAVNLGYEPQWLLVKNTQAAGGWLLIDNMRGFAQTLNAYLFPDLSAAETTANSYLIKPSATGFFSDIGTLASNNTYIYIAIRRGPMKTPTDATKVFSPNAFNAVANTYQTTGFPIDWQTTVDRNGAADKRTYSRLTGVATPGTTAGKYMSTNTTDAEAATSSLTVGWDNTGFKVPSSYASTPFVAWNFGRAPGFFDQVCYTGTGSATTVTHNLGVVPELMIVKRRSAIASWVVYSAATGNNVALVLNSNGTGSSGNDEWNSTTPTASVFSVGTAGNSNASGSTYIAYLFASCPGVSKVGSYTGTGATQTISCGFTGGARFVVIKRTDSTGNWWVWDTARGMVAGTDPRSLFNDTNAETNANWVYTATGGFQIVTTDATVNANGGSYLYLAVA